MTQGYPKIVSVSKISSRVDVETYFEGEKKAVALAPGVWTNLPDGAELEDAVANEALIGLCASIDAFERQNPDICRAVALAGEGSRCDPLVTAVLARIWYADRDRRTRWVMEVVKRRPGLCCHNVLVRRYAATSIGVRRPAPSRLSRKVPLALALSVGSMVVDRRPDARHWPSCRSEQLVAQHGRQPASDAAMPFVGGSAG